jgi:4-amino-4-deoxy-L-arabinose transferase-like glycosyltransferase
MVFTMTLLLAAVSLFALLGRRDIVTSHEARVVQTARQMAVSGWPWQSPRVSVPHGTERIDVNPWIVPVLNGEIRLKKPPLPYWSDAVLFRWVGFSEGIARFPSALLGFLGALLIYDLARRVIGARAALPAMLIWITTHFVVDEFRKAMADPYLAFATLMAMWAWVRAGRRSSFLLLFYVGLAIGVLAKGPVIFVTVLPGLVMWTVIRKPARKSSLRFHIVGIVMFILLVAPWAMMVMRQVPHAIDIWKAELEGDDKPRAAIYYLLTIWQLTLLWTIPWLISIVVTFLHGWRGLWSPRGRRRVFALGWMLAILIIFSLKAEKKNAYLLPLMPASILLSADGVGMMLFLSRRKIGVGLSRIAMTAQALIGVGFAVSVLVLIIRHHLGANRIGVSAVVVLIALLPLRAIQVHQPFRWLLTQVVAYVAVLMVFIGVYMAWTDRLRSPRAFASSVYEVSERTHVPIWRAKSPEEVTVYLPLDLAPSNGARQVLIAVDDPKGELLGTPREFEAITDGIRVIDVRPVQLPTSTGTRYRLYELTLDRGAGSIAWEGEAPSEPSL